MATELRYVGEKKEDGTWKGLKSMRQDMDEAPAGRYIFTCKKYRKSLSNKQNAYYWACVVPYVIDGLVAMGFDKSLLTSENVHEMLKAKFLHEDLGTNDGEFITITKSTTDLSTSEFMDYLADVQKWAAEFLNITIPDPGEQSEISY